MNISWYRSWSFVALPIQFDITKNSIDTNTDISMDESILPLQSIYRLVEKGVCTVPFPYEIAIFDQIFQTSISKYMKCAV